jgi:uncharacterized protein YbbK (DUF523 family)
VKAKGDVIKHRGKGLTRNLIWGASEILKPIVLYVLNTFECRKSPSCSVQFGAITSVRFHI